MNRMQAQSAIEEGLVDLLKDRDQEALEVVMSNSRTGTPFQWMT